jgi:hypothetical protein
LPNHYKVNGSPYPFHSADKKHDLNNADSPFLAYKQNKNAPRHNTDKRKNPCAVIVGSKKSYTYDNGYELKKVHIFSISGEIPINYS